MGATHRLAPWPRRKSAALTIYTAIVVVSAAALAAIGAWVIAAIYAGLMFGLLGVIAAVRKPVAQPP